MSDLDDYCEEIGLGRLAAGALRQDAVRLLSILGAEIASGVSAPSSSRSSAPTQKRSGRPKGQAVEAVEAKRDALADYIAENPGLGGREIREAAFPGLTNGQFTKLTSVLMATGRVTRRGKGSGSIWMPGTGKISKPATTGRRIPIEKDEAKKKLVEWLQKNEGPVGATAVVNGCAGFASKTLIYGLLKALSDEKLIKVSGAEGSRRYAAKGGAAATKISAGPDHTVSFQQYTPFEKLTAICKVVAKRPEISGRAIAAVLGVDDGTHHLKGTLQRGLKEKYLKKKGDRQGTVYSRTKKALA